MPLTEQTQSLADFCQRATETLDRLNETDEAQTITVDGEARAILLSPSAYDELEAVSKPPAEQCSWLAKAGKA